MSGNNSNKTMNPNLVLGLKCIGAAIGVAVLGFGTKYVIEKVRTLKSARELASIELEKENEELSYSSSDSEEECICTGEPKEQCICDGEPKEECDC